MTVQQLINKLQRMRRDLPVCIDLYDKNGDGSYSDFTIEEQDEMGVLIQPNDIKTEGANNEA